MSCFGGPLAGKVTVGLALKAPVTVIPVLATTGASVGLGAPAGDVDAVGDGRLDEGLGPADGDREPDEQALSEMTAAATRASRVGTPRNRVRTMSAIDSHFLASPAVVRA